jgi:hypothetical protein
LTFQPAPFAEVNAAIEEMRKEHRPLADDSPEIVNPVCRKELTQIPAFA